MPAGRPRGSATVIEWHRPETLQFIMSNYEEMRQQGYIKPPVRTLLYYLMGKDPEHWNKSYATGLSNFLERCKRQHLIPYGLFSDDSGGADYIPSTRSQIDEQVRIWQETLPLKLSRDRNLYALFVEHAGLVTTCESLFAQQLSIISSGGELRHEHLYARIKRLQENLHELNGRQIKIIGFADYDKYGAKGIEEGQGHILRNLKEWLHDVFPDIGFILYGLKEDQIRDVNLDPQENYQFDGWIGLYGLPSFKSDILRIAKLHLTA